MVDIARVNLYGQPVGTFRWDNNRQLAHFEYADSFIGKGLEPSPIHCQILTGEHCLIVGSRSPGVAAGTLWRHYVTSVNAAWERWNSNRPWMRPIVRMSE